MNLSLKGKNALIAGSSAGIGLAIAKELALLGANCFLMARNEEKLKKAVEKLDISQDQKHNYVIADFFNKEEITKSVNDLVKENNIHILINNSGGPPSGSIVQANENDFLTAYQQHLIGNHILTTAVIDGMKKDNYGRIINIISTSIKIPLKGLGVSNTTRGAVAAWSKTMSLELAPFGITVNNVLPGATLTDRLTTIIENKAQKTAASIDEVSEEMLAEIPMNRFGKPEEIAAMAAFLCTPAAAYVTGVSVQVDGGRTGSLT